MKTVTKGGDVIYGIEFGAEEMRIAWSVHFARMVGNRRTHTVLVRKSDRRSKLEDLTANGNCNFQYCIVEALCETREHSWCCYLAGFIGLPVE